MDTRAPPPQGPPPSYAFVTKVYRSSLRPVVLFNTFIGGVWALFSSIGYFRNLSIDRTHTVPKLTVYSIALGAVYMGVFGIQLLGFTSATLNRTPLVRIYAYTSIIAALAVAGAGLLDIIVHFTLKQDIIQICSQLTTGNEVIYYGFFGPVYRTVTNGQAVQYCTNLWNHDSWTDIIAFLLTTFLAILFCSIAFAYLHQLNDPTSPVNSARAPSTQARMSGFPLYYSPPYNTHHSGPYPYGGQQPYGDYYGSQGHAGNAPTGPYAPPPGPPPHEERDDPFVPPDDSKPPSYMGGHGMEFGDDKDEKEDPFEPPREERDVTSRPATGRRF